MTRDDEPVDAEFVDARPVKPASWKCHCPACRAAIAAGNYCDTCLSTCVPALRKIHAAHPALRQGQQDARELASGIKAAGRTARNVRQAAEGIADVLGALAGKRGRR